MFLCHSNNIYSRLLIFTESVSPMMHRGSFNILRSFSARHFQLDVDEAILVGCSSNLIILRSEHLVMMGVGKSLKASQTKSVLVSWLTLLHVPAKCGIKPSATAFPGQFT